MDGIRIRIKATVSAERDNPGREYTLDEIEIVADPAAIGALKEGEGEGAGGISTSSMLLMLMMMGSRKPGLGPGAPLEIAEAQGAGGAQPPADSKG